MFKYEPSVSFDKKLVFYLNFLLVIIVMYSFLLKISLKYFFYFNIILTLVFSYVFFRKSRELSKILIVSNLFIFFYFLSPQVSEFLFDLLGRSSQFLVLFYNFIIAYIFLVFSGLHKHFLGNLRMFSWRIFFIVMLVGFFFSLLFVFANEPVSILLQDVSGPDMLMSLIAIASIAFLVGLNEQMIFSGLFFNMYKKLSSPFHATIYTSILFVAFHFIRFDFLYDFYSQYSSFLSPIYIAVYYILLFLFMMSALYFYSLDTKKYKGNFFYPFILHVSTDFFLFAFYYFTYLR